MDSSWSKSRNLERSFIVRIHCFVSLKSFPSGSILGKLIERVYSLRITPIYSLMHVMVADWYQRIAPRYNWVFQQKKIKSIVHTLTYLLCTKYAKNCQGKYVKNTSLYFPLKIVCPSEEAKMTWRSMLEFV